MLEPEGKNRKSPTILFEEYYSKYQIKIVELFEEKENEIKSCNDIIER